MEPLFGLVIATAVSMAIIPLMWRLAPQLGLIDEPNARKVHKAPIPSVGGWGIVIGALVPAMFQLAWTPLFKSYLAGALILFLFGVIDDRVTLSHRVKFIGQFAAAGLVIFYGDLWIHHAPFIPEELWPRWAGVALSFFAIVGMINAMNTSDGLDGLAGGESLLSLMVIAFLAYMVDGVETLIYAVTAIGGVLGFLRFNTFPARVFMGDAGSQFLGFSLGFLAILLTQKTFETLSPATTLLFLGLPIIDIFAVMFLRIARGQSPFKAGRNHVHHRLLDLGFSHTETVIIIYCLHGAMVVSAILLRHESDWLVAGVYFATVAAIFLLLRVAEHAGWRRPKRHQSVVEDLDSTMARGRLARLPIYIVTAMAPLYLLYSGWTMAVVPRDFGVTSAVLAAVLLLDMLFGRGNITFPMRGAVYVAAVFVSYLAAQEAGESVMSTAEMAYFVVLAIALGLTVRYSASVRFETSPMDYLILGGVIIATVFGQGRLETHTVSVIIVKAVLLLYACEIVIERSQSRWNTLNIAALAVLGMFAWRGLLSS